MLGGMKERDGSTKKTVVVAQHHSCTCTSPPSSSPLSRLSIHPILTNEKAGRTHSPIPLLLNLPYGFNSIPFFFFPQKGKESPPSNIYLQQRHPTRPAHTTYSPQMEFAAASSSDANPYHGPRPGPPHPHPVADRILRALHHRLLLLHRSDPDFFILGATGNVYTVSLSTSPSCTCPDRTTPCKHILFVLIRVLGVPLDDPCLRRRTLRQCRLRSLLSAPSDIATLASASLRARFHERFFLARKHSGGNEWRGRPHRRTGEEDGDEPETCPICLEEMGVAGGEGGRAVACMTCRNRVHEECLLRWKKSLGRRSAICVMCRSRWRMEREPDRYVNLAAYVGEDEGQSRMAEGICRD